MDEIQPTDRNDEMPAGQLPSAEDMGPAVDENAMMPVDDPNSEANTRKRQEQALMFEKYLEESGLCLSFQIIFTEIIQKQIPEDQVFPYTAMRLRQIGKELESTQA